MELNDLRSTWQNAGNPILSEADLQRMTKISNHPSLKKIRAKLIIETIALTLFLLVYEDWFDGDTKPFYANVLLVTGILLFILNDVVGLVSLINPVRGGNLKVSMQRYFNRVKWLAVFSITLSFAYGLLLILYFASVINFTRDKYWILTGILITLILVTFISFRIWVKWIKNLKQQVHNFNHDDGN